MRYQLERVKIDELVKLAQAGGVNMGTLSTAAAKAAGFSAAKKTTFKKLDLDKGIYAQAQADDISVSELLEQEDPSANYPGVPLDAFERQLAARGLAVAGSKAITLEEFYEVPESRVLFPEFIDREIRAGMLIGRYTVKDDDLIAIETQIDSGKYESAIADETGDFSAKIIAEGAKFPRITISTADKVVTLRKRGYLIAETYEHRRRLRANKMAVFLRLIGWQLALDKAEDCVDVIVNGNTGNSNGAASFTLTGLNFNNFVKFLAELDIYEPDVWVMPKAGWSDTLTLDEFKQHSTGNQFKESGVPLDPFGAGIKRHDRGGSILENKVLAVNRQFSVERVVERGAMIQETDRIIDGQWNELTVSMVIGYAKIIAGASTVWDYA